MQHTGSSSMQMNRESNLITKPVYFQQKKEKTHKNSPFKAQADLGSQFYSSRDEIKDMMSKTLTSYGNIKFTTDIFRPNNLSNQQHGSGSAVKKSTKGSSSPFLIKKNKGVSASRYRSQNILIQSSPNDSPKYKKQQLLYNKMNSTMRQVDHSKESHFRSSYLSPHKQTDLEDQGKVYRSMENSMIAHRSMPQLRWSATNGPKAKYHEVSTAKKIHNGDLSTTYSNLKIRNTFDSKNLTNDSILNKYPVFSSQKIKSYKHELNFHRSSQPSLLKQDVFNKSTINNGSMDDYDSRKNRGLNKLMINRPDSNIFQRKNQVQLAQPESDFSKTQMSNFRGQISLKSKISKLGLSLANRRLQFDLTDRNIQQLQSKNQSIIEKSKNGLNEDSKKTAGDQADLRMQEIAKKLKNVSSLSYVSFLTTLSLVFFWSWKNLFLKF